MEDHWTLVKYSHDRDPAGRQGVSRRTCDSLKTWAAVLGVQGLLRTWRGEVDAKLLAPKTGVLPAPRVASIAGLRGGTSRSVTL